MGHPTGTGGRYNISGMLFFVFLFLEVSHPHYSTDPHEREFVVVVGSYNL